MPPGVEGHPDPGDLALPDLHPVRHRHRFGHAGGHVVPGQHVGPVGEDLADVDAGDDPRQPFEAAQARVTAGDLAERPGEVHVVGEHRAQPREVPRLPSVEVDPGCLSRAVVVMSHNRNPSCYPAAGRHPRAALADR